MTLLPTILIFVLVLKFTSSASCIKGSGSTDTSMQSLPNSGITYLVSTQEVTWFEAFVLCQRNGMELASITTKAEQDAIEVVLKEYPTTVGGLHGYFTSATRHGACTNQFVWFGSGKPVIYSKFAPGQPDNAAAKEACVEVFLQNNGKYFWNDLPCEHKLGYICQTRKDCCSAISED